MSTPQPQTRKPTPKQLRYLRDLALRCGQSFAYPRTSAEASREIDRLKQLRRTPAADRRRELNEVSRDMDEGRGDGARVDAELEIEGYGSTATWASTTLDDD
jgi:hypothetical protein